MEQVEIFCTLSEEDRLQKNINTWLTKNNGMVEVTRVLQTQSQSGHLARHLTISIFYKTKFKEQ